MSGIAAPVVGGGVIPPTEQQIEATKATPRADNVDSSASSQTQAGEDGNQVNVKEAERQFEELRRQLSRASSLHRTRTGDKDGEKEGDDSDDFDLLEYLQGGLEARDNAGFKRKVVGVTWDNLRVTGAGGMKIFIRTFPDAIKEFILSPVFMILKQTKMFAPKPKDLLVDFNGCAKPGEMVLVLGRPGSGCTTFLKTIGLQRGGYLSVEGDVLYGGIDSKKMGKQYLGEVAYNQEDDVHHATLTVAQTLMFALNTKTPGKRLPNQSAAEFKRQVLDLLVNMLGISHTKNTKVGNAFVRGVSGGERKRVSIAEMMTARSSVCCWDNSTRGLDASTALDYAKSLRILTDVFQLSTFTTLYQAGEGIYDCFDKVLVLDEGREVYFGPVKEARQYMVSLGYADLPRQTSADFLSGITDPNERQYQEGRDASNVPSTPEALEAAFKASDIHARMITEREAFKAEIAAEQGRRADFEAAVQDDKHRAVSKKSPYTVSFPSQVWALVIRQVQLKMQDRFDLYVSFATSIIVALISGSVYFQLPQTSAGAFTRGGAIFIAILFNSFQAFNELPTQMMGRAIMWKHAGFTFHRPAALTLASTIADAPFNMLQILIFSIIIYFMAGLASGAGAFFSFYVIVLAGYFSLAAFFRLLGTFCSSYDVAARLASILITFMILYSGYLIPVFSMKRWLFWIYYINPLNYSFSAAMMNEFSRIDLTCDGAYITPRNVGGITKYPADLGPNQVCTLVGSTPGTAAVSGAQYIAGNFEYDVANLWRNFGITLVFFIGFNIMQAWAVERFKHGADAPAINVFRKENKETKALNERLQENKVAFRKGEQEQDLSGLINTRKPFTWENLTYTVPVPGGKKQLLDNVFGYVKPGTLTALMGSSGAGKTTLLDVLASRKTIGVVGGDILINGRKPGLEFQRGTAYCEQQDTHEHTATVREAFRFSAYLRQPAHISKEEKDRYVEEVIQLLELEDLADAMIGFPGFGLGVEARKRVTIGVELASKPQLLLFLDEPTSGLDGQSAYNIVRFLKKLAAAGQAILVTVHQPNALLFENFDRLLLLKAGGRCVYFGPIGKDSSVIRDYFAKHGAHCPENANPAEYMLEAIGAGSRRMVGKTDWADLWLESPELVQVKEEIQALKAEGLAQPDDTDDGSHSQYATPFTTQMKVVGERTFTAFWRSPDYGFTRLFNHISIGLCVSLTFLNLGDNVAALQYRVFALFFVTVLPAIIISQIEPTFIMGRQTFIRESSSKMYSQVVFALSQLAAESPYSLLCAVAFFLLLYYPMGFNKATDRAGYQFFVVLVTEFFAVTLGQGVAALSPSIYIAALQNPFLLVIFSLFCGVTIPKPNMPYFWRSWLYDLDPFTRIISGMVSTELHGLSITCLPREFHEFQPPAGQTCFEWAQDFIDIAGGYLQDGSLTENCQYCQCEPFPVLLISLREYANFYFPTDSVGDEFYTPLSICEFRRSLCKACYALESRD
ncbi:pleiotropic drug resistance ABC transporter [Leucosporidium creatinivorum]|uniref:Pleiotropic drug resistance ABC transporter n=1 Tax=Leucosporidium creatinivorum TaxID=106004 RepID=A0A1Y2DL60_9BASI|nr:pleiotropic drug resistance ABC transporter [Leucosporidium creatinivorum]